MIDNEKDSPGPIRLSISTDGTMQGTLVYDLNTGAVVENVVAARFDTEAPNGPTLLTVTVAMPPREFKRP